MTKNILHAIFSPSSEYILGSDQKGIVYVWLYKELLVYSIYFVNYLFKSNNFSKLLMKGRK